MNFTFLKRLEYSIFFYIILIYKKIRNITSKFKIQHKIENNFKNWNQHKEN